MGGVRCKESRSLEKKHLYLMRTKHNCKKAPGQISGRSVLEGEGGITIWQWNVAGGYIQSAASGWEEGAILNSYRSATN